MNTTVWLITFTDSNGKLAQTVHTHNCVADFRVIDKNATAQEIDCTAVAELIEAARVVLDPESTPSVAAQFDRLAAALARVGGGA